MYFGSIPTPWEVAALIAIGFSVGMAGSFFGVGGAFIVTPALNILGFPMSYAIGTDLAHMVGKSIIAVVRHRRLGQVDVKAGFFLLIGTLPGVKLGADTVMRLEHLGMTEWVVRAVYIMLLTTIGSLSLRESLRAHLKGEHERRPALLQKHFRLKPMVSLKASGIEQISIWSIILLGLVTGFLAAFLGVGGGFIRMPAMLYLIGMPTRVAVGTDLLEVLFSGGYGTFLYALKGRVDVIAALVMLMGAGIGSHLGVLATQYVQPARIRLYFAVTVLGAAVAVMAKQAGLTTLSLIVLMTLGTGLAGIISWRLFQGIRAARQTKSV